MKQWILLGLLVTPALAQPEAVVRQFYGYYLQHPGEREAVVANQHCFTPTFYRLFNQLESLRSKNPGYAYDNYLSWGNGGWGDFAVGSATIDGTSAVVPLTLWCGLRSEQVRHNRELRRTWKKTYADVYLTHLKGEWQIYDLRYLARGHGIRQDIRSEIQDFRKLAR